MEHLAGQVRDFNRYYTRRIGILTDRYLGQARPLGEARLLFEIGTGLEVGALRVRLGLDSGYLSRLLRSLEKQRLVHVTPHPGDARARVAHLTDAGSRELEVLNTRATDTARELIASLSAMQQEQVVDAMGRLQRLLRLAAVIVAPADPASPVARTSLTLFADELKERFPEGYRNSDLVSADQIVPPHGVLLVATEDNRPIGCGAVRILQPPTGEIRHMWVHPDARRMGLGRRLVTDLERHALDLGVTALRLGTHETLREAIAMYEALGYTPTSPYGDTTHTHCWFAKELTESNATLG